MWIAAFQPASLGDCPNITDAGFLLVIAHEDVKLDAQCVLGPSTGRNLGSLDLPAKRRRGRVRTEIANGQVADEYTSQWQR